MANGSPNPYVDVGDPVVILKRLREILGTPDAHSITTHVETLVRQREILTSKLRKESAYSPRLGYMSYAEGTEPRIAHLIYENAHKDQPLPKWLTSWGLERVNGYLTPGLPQPFKEISWHEFYHNVTAYSTIVKEYRQIRNPDIYRYTTDAIIFWYEGGAYAQVQVKDWRCATAEEKEALGFGIIYEQPKYFRIGCSHDKPEERVVGNCLRRYTCRDCGFTWEIDSSD